MNSRFNKFSRKDYQQIDNAEGSSQRSSEKQSSERAGGALRWMVEGALKQKKEDSEEKQRLINNDAEGSRQRPSERTGGAVGDRLKQKSKAIEEAQDMINNVDSAQSLVNTLRRSDNSYDSLINALIRDTDEVKHWIKENQKPLELSPKEYRNMRREYNAARDAWQNRASSSLADGVAQMGSGLAEMGGYVPPSTGAIERPREEIDSMRREVMIPYRSLRVEKEEERRGQKNLKSVSRW